jgi:hypothetical protein
MGRAILSLTLILLALGPPRSAKGQEPVDVSGVVIDVATGEPIGDVVLRLLGSDVSAATDEEGRFVLRGVVPGRWTLQVTHLAYGSHEHVIAVESGQRIELQVRLAAEAIELDPLVVEARSTREQAERAQGSSLHVVTRPEIERAIGTSKHLGDLIRQTVPGLKVRQGNNLAGTDVCLEFRAAATISLLETRPCNHPMVFLDGVPVSEPNYLYGSLPLQTIERIQVIPPGEAGARYGTGSLYGVLLIETRSPRAARTGDDRAYAPLHTGRRTFDWSTDPAGHNLTRTLTGAMIGNGVGLALGLALGRQCIQVDDKQQIATQCGLAGDGAAALAAMALPALGSALGARIGGRTDASVGRLAPTLVGAGMMIFPGYAFSMSSVGGGTKVANTLGHAFLLVGAPLFTTLADRLFRKLRDQL